MDFEGLEKFEVNFEAKDLRFALVVLLSPVLVTLRTENKSCSLCLFESYMHNYRPVNLWSCVKLNTA